MILAGQQITMTMVTDGTSNTALISELMRWGQGDDRRGRIYNSYQGETFFSTLYAPNTLSADAQYSCGTSLPNYMPCTAVVNGANSINSARSHHSGRSTVNLALADGSVKSIGNNILIAAWQALGTRAGNESITDSNY